MLQLLVVFVLSVLCGVNVYWGTGNKHLGNAATLALLALNEIRG